MRAKQPPWMEMDQRWSNMNVLTANRERVLCWAGHAEICAKALRDFSGEDGDSTMERQVCMTASKAVQNLQMGGYCVDEGIQSLWGTQVVSQNLFDSLQDGYMFAQNHGQWRLFAKCGKTSTLTLSY